MVYSPWSLVFGRESGLWLLGNGEWGRRSLVFGPLFLVGEAGKDAMMRGCVNALMRIELLNFPLSTKDQGQKTKDSHPQYIFPPRVN